MQRAREHRAHLVVLVGREEVEHAVDRLGGVEGVDRREHEVAGLGRRHRRLHGLLVAHLADQDHVGVLAQDVAQRVLEGGVSSPTSRWPISERWSSWTNSIGSSIVTMFAARWS